MSETPIQINSRSLTMLANMTGFVQSMKEAKASKINVKGIGLSKTLLKNAATKPGTLAKELLALRYELLKATFETRLLPALHEVLPAELNKFLKQANYDVTASFTSVPSIETSQIAENYSSSRLMAVRVGFKPEARSPDILAAINNTFPLLEEGMSCSPRHVVNLMVDDTYNRRHLHNETEHGIQSMGYTGWLIATIGHLNIHMTRIPTGTIGFYVTDNRVPVNFQDESRDMFTFPVLYWATVTRNYIQFIINPNQTATTNDIMMFFTLYGYLTNGIAKTPLLLKLISVMGAGIIPSKKLAAELEAVMTKSGSVANELILNRQELFATSLIKALGSICSLLELEAMFRRVATPVVVPTGDPEVDALAMLVAQQIGQQRR